MKSSILPCTLTRLLLLLCLLAPAVHLAQAQGTSDGSIYSRFGVGELRSFASSQIQALGGGGTALPAYNYVNYSNPASLADQLLTRVSAGVLYQGLQATDAAENTSMLTEGSLNAVQFGFPLLARRLGVGFSFAPYSRVSYQVDTPGVLLPGETAVPDTAAFLTSFEGGGGLQQVTGGAGYRLNENISLGASLNFLFGILEEGRTTRFLVPGYTTTRLTTATRLYGVTATAGGRFSFPSLLGEKDMLSIGATFTLPASLEATRVRTLGESLDRDTLGTEVEGSLRLPLSTSLGLAYHPDERWTVVVGGVYEPWSRFSSTLSLPGYEPDGVSTFQDRLRGSAGFEFYPAGTDQTTTFFERVAYRLGFYYDEAYVTPLVTPSTGGEAAEVDLRTLALTGGLSIPTLFPGTRLDVNFEVGTRGTTDRDLVRDQFYRVALNVNFGERWFEKRKLR